jgi:hypothetical protein
MWDCGFRVGIVQKSGARAGKQAGKQAVRQADRQAGRQGHAKQTLHTVLSSHTLAPLPAPRCCGLKHRNLSVVDFHATGTSSPVMSNTGCCLCLYIYAASAALPPTCCCSCSRLALSAAAWSANRCRLEGGL